MNKISMSDKPLIQRTEEEIKKHRDLCIEHSQLLSVNTTKSGEERMEELKSIFDS